MTSDRRLGRLMAAAGMLLGTTTVTGATIPTSNRWAPRRYASFVSSWNTKTCFPAESSSTSLGISETGGMARSFTRGVDMEEAVMREQEKDQFTKFIPQPADVTARSTLNGAVLVSGWSKPESTIGYKTVFDRLNDEESPFDFQRIIAFVDDVELARKRLISRSARYTGLLDKLAFEQSEAPGALPTIAQLEGVTNWVSLIEDGNIDTLKKMGDQAKTAGVKNIAILLSNAESVDMTEVQSVVDSFKTESFQFNIVTTGELVDGRAEGTTPYAVYDIGAANATIDATTNFTLSESIRILTTALTLEETASTAVVIKENFVANSTEALLIRGLREIGYSRPQEIHYMLTGGAKKYYSDVQNYGKGNTATQEMMYDLHPWLKYMEEDAELKEAQKIIGDRDKVKRKQILKIAEEWAHREYWKKCSLDEMPFSEGEFIDSIWERAQYEGVLQWRRLKGIDPDYEDAKKRLKIIEKERRQRMMDKARLRLESLLKATKYYDVDMDDKDNGLYNEDFETIARRLEKDDRRRRFVVSKLAAARRRERLGLEEPKTLKQLLEGLNDNEEKEAAKAGMAKMIRKYIYDIDDDDDLLYPQ